MIRRYKMKRVMSTKEVLSALLDEWNENSFVSNYYLSISDIDGMQKAQEAQCAIGAVLDKLGFCEDIDYTANRIDENRNGETLFSYWKLEME